MPITPMHFGPAVLAKGMAPQAISLSAFLAVQVAIDLESGYYLLVAREWPVHRVVHTFLCSGLVGVVVGVSTWIAFWLLRNHAVGRGLEGDGGWRRCLLGGAVGGLSHPLLDALIHSDIQPLAPFAAGNPFLGLVNRSELHAICVLSGLVGLTILLVRGRSGQGATREG